MVALLLLVALVFRSAVPAGWMPNTARAGAAPVVICTGTGAMAWTHVPRQPPAKPHQSAHPDVCAFAGWASSPAPEMAPPPAPVGGWTRIARAEPQHAPALDRRGHSEQAARAPPASI